MTTDAEADSRSRPEARLRTRALLTIGALTAVAPFVTDLYLPALPDLARSLATTETQAQLTLSVCLVGLALGQLVAGPLSDRIGRMRPLRWGLVALGVTSLLCAVAPGTTVLLVLRLVQGLAGAAALVIARAMVRDVYHGSRAARIFSELMLVTGLAPIVAPVLGGQLLRFTDWRGTFIVLSLISALLLAATWLALEETNPAHRIAQRRSGSFGNLVRDGHFLAYMLINGLLGAMLFTYISMSSFVLRGEYSLSPAAYSFAFASNAVGMIVGGRMNAAWVVHRGPAAMLALGLVLATLASTATAIALWLEAPLVVVLTALWLVLVSFGLSVGNAVALAMTPHGEVAGAAAAMLGASQFLFGALVPPVVSLGGLGGPVMGLTMTGAASLALLTLVAMRAPGAHHHDVSQ